MKSDPVMKKSQRKGHSSKENAPQKAKGFFAFLQERNPHLFAHHPNHPAFREHIWIYRGCYFCKGCSVTFTGIIFGGLFYLLTGWLRWFSEPQIGLIFFGLLLPSVITSLVDSPRVVKHIARFLLGILVISALVMLFVTDDWIVRFAIIGIFLAVRIPLEKKRRRDNDTVIKAMGVRKS
jgi:hypothetical protein